VWLTVDVFVNDSYDDVGEVKQLLVLTKLYTQRDRYLHTPSQLCFVHADGVTTLLHCVFCTVEICENGLQHSHSLPFPWCLRCNSHSCPLPKSIPIPSHSHSRLTHEQHLSWKQNFAAQIQALYFVASHFWFLSNFSPLSCKLLRRCVISCVLLIYHTSAFTHLWSFTFVHDCWHRGSTGRYNTSSEQLTTKYGRH